MKYLIGMLFSLSLFAGAQASAQAALSMSDCRDIFYEQAGATWDQALRVCVQRSDTRFVNCVVDRYNDYSYSHSFDSAVNICQGRISGGINVNQCQNDFVQALGISQRSAAGFCQQGLTKTFASCVSDLRQKLDFTTERAIQLCQWSDEKTIYLCAQRKYRDSERSNERAVVRCYEEYSRGELNSFGENRRELAEQARRDQQRAPAVPKAPVVPKKVEPSVPKKSEATKAESSVPKQMESKVPPRVTPTPSKQSEPKASRDPEPKAPKAPEPKAPKTPEPKAPAPEQPSAPKCLLGQAGCDDGGVIVDLPNL